MRRRTAAVGLAALLALAACGTRLPDEAFVDANGEAVATDGATGVAAGEDPAAATDGAAGAGEAATATDGATTGGDTTGGAAAGGTGGGGGAAAAANQASDVGITKDTITIGNIVAESGVLGDAFAPAARGMRAWAAAVNAKGGINGRQVVLKTCDDGEVRNKTLECAKRLVEQDKVFAIVGANTRSMGGAAEYLNSTGVPVIGMPITNSYYRYPHFWSGYPSGYERNGKTVGFNGQLVANTSIYRWFKTNLKVTKAAVFAYDIAESKQAGDSFLQGLKLEGFDATMYTVSFAAPSFDQAVAKMQQDGVQIVFDSMDDGANRKLCDAMARRKFSVKAKVSTVVSMGQKVGTTYNDTCRNSVYIPGSSIPYTTTSVPQVKAFRDAFAKYQPGKELHQWALEAWTQGQMVAEGVAKMGPTPTRKGLEDWFRSLDKYTAGGVMTGLDWRVKNNAANTAADCITIARWDDGNGGWVLATNKFPFCYSDAKQYRSPALEQGN